MTLNGQWRCHTSRRWRRHPIAGDQIYNFVALFLLVSSFLTPPTPPLLLHGTQSLSAELRFFARPANVHDHQKNGNIKGSLFCWSWQKSFWKPRDIGYLRKNRHLLNKNVKWLAQQIFCLSKQYSIRVISMGKMHTKTLKWSENKSMESLIS